MTDETETEKLAPIPYLLHLISERDELTRQIDNAMKDLSIDAKGLKAIIKAQAAAAAAKKTLDALMGAGITPE